MNLTRRWPLFLIAAPAAAAVWSGWVGLGGMCGFGIVHPLPGIASSVQLNTAITLPVGVEAYGAFALGAWLTPGTPDAARTFARGSAIGALALGMLGQVAFHLLTAWHQTHAPWPVVVLVACLPVVTLGFGAALMHLLGGHEAAAAADAVTAVVTATHAATEKSAVTGQRTLAVAEAHAAVAAQPRSQLTGPSHGPTMANRPAHMSTRPDRPRTDSVTGHRDRRAAAIVAERPDITGAELGSELGVSERTGRRILASMAAN